MSGETDREQIISILMELKESVGEVKAQVGIFSTAFAAHVVDDRTANAAMGELVNGLRIVGAEHKGERRVRSALWGFVAGLGPAAASVLYNVWKHK